MANTGKVLLLDFTMSPFCMRVKIALGEKGVKFEHQEENLMDKSELLISSNPIYQKVPVLIHNGKPLLESTIIVEYIDETWASSSLLPACTHGRAMARFWADFVDKKVFDAGKGIWGSAGEEKETATKNLIEILKQLEAGALGEKDYFGGDKFGFLDIIIIGVASWFPVYEKFGGFKVEDHCPKLSTWIKRCMQRETVAKVIPEPEKVCGFVAMMRKMYGLE